MDGSGFSVNVSAESMPDMRSGRSGGKTGKKKPKMMQASFQAGESSSAVAAQTAATMEQETQMIFD